MPAAPISSGWSRCWRRIQSWEVLDLGTGAGHAAMAAARQVQHVVAVDISPRMLAVTQRLCEEQGIVNLQVVQADGRSLPFGAERFDGAISRFSAHHWSDPDQVMHEVHRVLRPGAPFVLVDSMGPADTPLDSFLNALELLRDPSHGRNEPLAGPARPADQAGVRGGVRGRVDA